MSAGWARPLSTTVGTSLTIYTYYDIWIAWIFIDVRQMHNYYKSNLKYI